MNEGTRRLPIESDLDFPWIIVIESLDSLTSRKRVVIWPVVLVGTAAQHPDLLQLVEVRIPRKDRPARKHLTENTAGKKRSRMERLDEVNDHQPDSPHVNFPTILSRT
jgi:hypothetical protein